MNSTGFLVFVRSALIACTWGLASLLGGCGGSSDGVGEPLTSVSAPVGATGGALELQGLALTLPANAIPETINLSITSLTAGTGEIARFRLSPAGLALSAPAELRFIQAGMPAKASFFWDVGGELQLLRGTRAGDVLTAQILSLGLGSAGNTVSALGTSQTGLKRALAARPLAAPADDGGTVVVMPMDCAARIPEMAARLKRVAASDDSEAVIRAFDEIVAAKQLCLEAEVQALKDRSCEALDVAQLKAQSLVADSFKSFQELTLPLIAAEAFVQETGASCPSADSARVGPLIADKFDQFLRILQAQQLRGVFAEKATLRDIQELLSYQISCARLGLDAICERLDNEIFPNLFDGMRRGAFDECRSSGSPLVVSQLHFLGTSVTDTSTFLGFGRFGMADLEADMSYCTNPSLELRVFADATGVPEELTDRASTLRPLVGLGNYVRSTTVAVPRDGKLTVSGELAALRCADDTVSPADLVVRIGSQEVARRSVSGNAYPLSTAPLDLVMSQVLASAGLDPAQTDGFILTVNREGGQCLGALGPTLGESFTVFEVRVNLPASITSVAPGPFHGCALSGSGSVRCWGFSGRWLGHGSPDGVLVPDALVPAPVNGLGSGVTGIAVGTAHTCALTNSGGVKCWGDNGSGVLGDGTDVSSSLPVSVLGLESGVTSLSAGGSGACAVVQGGTVKCWGQGFTIGTAGSGDSGVPADNSPVPVAVPGLGSGVSAVRMSKAANRACAVIRGGAVMCWGFNTDGGLGNGSNLNSFVPVAVTGLTSGVTELAMGNNHACAVVGGRVKCWGSGGGGELGTGSRQSSSVPVDATELGGDVVGLSAASGSTCALTRAGSVMCLGIGAGGGLGNGAIADSLVAVPVAGLDGGVVSIAGSGNRRHCARTASGSVKCWGVAYLGDGTGNGSSVPVSVVGFP